MTSATPQFQHVFVPSQGAKITLLLLHGTGGNEHDLVPLGADLYPEAALLSPRGQVLERGMPRFFRRISEGVFDVPDLQARADALGAWTRQQIRERSAPSTVVAVGFSNGANIAAGMLLRSRDVLAGAVLIRAMVPYEPPDSPPVQGKKILLSQGTRDPLIPREQGERLAALFREGGADVSVAWQDAGHGLGPGDVQDARAFLRTFAAGHSASS